MASTSLDGSGGTGSASWSIRDQGCPSWVWEPEVVERGAPSSGGSRQEAGSNKEKGGNGGGTGEPRRRGVPRLKIGRGHGPYHFASGGWKHKEPLGGGPVNRSEWTHPEVGRAEEHRWRHQRMDWYYIGGQGAHGDQFNRASRTNCQPASQPETSRMSGKGANPQEKILCPKCGSRVQRQNLRKHDRSMHQGVRRRRQVCPYCSAEKCKTYSTFQDWKNHLHDTHEQCLEYDDPLKREEYAPGFKLDRWERFHDIEGDETDRAYLRIATLGKHYGQYQGQEEGEPPGPPSTIRLPHTKGTTPDRDVTPTESERAGSEQGGSGQEEGEISQTEGDEPGSYTRMRSKDSDSGSDDTTTGRDSWRSARGKETVVLTTPHPRGRGKRRADRGGGIAKRPRMESSLSERRDESEESRSGGTMDRPGRGGKRAAGPSTPPRRPPPSSISPRRSLRLTTSAVRDLQSLPLAAKSDRRIAHS